MRCPKCSYLSYEDVERCRNCGYDFALAAAPPEADLPIRLDTPTGTRSWEAPASRGTRTSDDALTPRTEGTAVDLPLFGEPAPAAVPESPPVTIPPALPPLVVRRTVDVPRAAPSASGPRTPSRTRPAPAPALDFQTPPDDAEPPIRQAVGPRPPDDEIQDDEADGDESSGLLVRRMAAGGIDAALLLALDALVVWLTLRSLGLSPDDVWVLPLAPLLGFLFLLNTSYLVTFTAAAGQTIGQMTTDVRVVHDSYRRVPFGHAVLRSVVLLICAVPAGIGLLPVLFGDDARGLHDRLAGTRVIAAGA